MQNSIFMEALEDALKNDDEEVCLISKDPLNQYNITLECKHSFNYIPLYNEIKKQKLENNKLSYTKLNIYEIQCPYCRNIQNKLIPYFPLYDINRIIGVNSPEIYTMLPNKCEHVFKKGKNKSLVCNKDCYLNFCKNHFIYNNTDSYKNNDIDINNIINLKMPELKAIAKKLRLKRYSKLKKEMLINLIKDNISINNISK